MEDQKTILTLTVIAIVAIAGIVLFVNSTTTGMISGQQKLPYAWVYGPQEWNNPCKVVQCPENQIAMPVGIERYTNRVTCICHDKYTPYYEMPSYIITG